MILRRQVWTLIVCLVLVVGLRLVWGEEVWSDPFFTNRNDSECWGPPDAYYCVNTGQPTGVVPAPRQWHGGPGVHCTDWEEPDADVVCRVDPNVLACQQRLYEVLQEVWERQWNERGAAGYWSHAREAKVQQVLTDCKPEERR